MLDLVIACGGGIFTTSVVSEQVSDILRKAGIKFNITPKKLSEVQALEGYDLIVVTGKFTVGNKAGIPILSGITLLAGSKDQKEEFAKELVDKVHEIKG